MLIVVNQNVLSNYLNKQKIKQILKFYLHVFHYFLMQREPKSIKYSFSFFETELNAVINFNASVSLATTERIYRFREEYFATLCREFFFLIFRQS